MEPVFFSEIAKFPSILLKHHYPDVPNLGDMEAFEEWGDYEIDILVGGTPCQSYSVAGLREGLRDPRGSLMLTFLAIAGRYKPRWIVWENVPGVLSSNKGRDFGTFLTALAELGYHASWRVLDAQYVRVDGFGRAVPQRRRRVFVVGHIGDWRNPAAVLFERQSLFGDTPPRRSEAEEVAGTFEGGVAERGKPDNRVVPDVANTLTARMHKGVNSTLDEGQTLVADVAGTLYANFGKSHGAEDQRIKQGAPLYVIKAPGEHVPVSSDDVWSIRRLTPRECERLQGFPDDYTLIPEYARKRKVADADEIARWILSCNPEMGIDEAMHLSSHPDSPRYSALGNSMAVNVMRWIGSRIVGVESGEIGHNEPTASPLERLVSRLISI